MRIGPQIVPFAGNNIAPIKNRKNKNGVKLSLTPFLF
jgi:hypothetical protein